MQLDAKSLILFIAPAILFFGLIYVYPALSTLSLSLFDVANFSFTDATFVGLQNFSSLMTTPLFLLSLRNIFVIWLVGGIVVFGLSFLFVALLRTLPPWPRNFFRAAIFLPNIVNVVAIVTIWTQYVYNPRGGLLVGLSNALGLTDLVRVQWMAPDMVFWAMLVAYLWGALGWFAVIIMAGEETIPTDIYEAARLDGAKGARLFFDFTIPLIFGVLKVAVVMWTVTVINLFAFVKAFNPIATSEQTYTPALYLYELAFGATISGGPQQVGKAAAAATILLVLVLVAATIVERLMRRERLEY